MIEILLGGLGSGLLAILISTAVMARYRRQDRWERREQARLERNREVATKLLPLFEKAQRLTRPHEPPDEGWHAWQEERQVHHDEIDATILRLDEAEARRRLTDLAEGLSERSSMAGDSRLCWPPDVEWPLREETRAILGAIARHEPLPEPSGWITANFTPALADQRDYRRSQWEHYQMLAEQDPKFDEADLARMEHEQARRKAERVRAAAQAIVEAKLEGIDDDEEALRAVDEEPARSETETARTIAAVRLEGEDVIDDEGANVEELGDSEAAKRKVRSRRTLPDLERVPGRARPSQQHLALHGLEQRS